AMSPIRAGLAQHVRRRARGCCEYCRSQERMVGEEFTMDHIIPRAKGGSGDASNLALCCYVCNPLKGDRTEAPDPQTGKMAPLFHPPRPPWRTPLRWSDAG